MMLEDIVTPDDKRKLYEIACEKLIAIDLQREAMISKVKRLPDIKVISGKDGSGLVLGENLIKPLVGQTIPDDILKIIREQQSRWSRLARLRKGYRHTKAKYEAKARKAKKNELSGEFWDKVDDATSARTM